MSKEPNLPGERLSPKLGEARRRHFVLVHGACHGAWCWYKVLTLLKSAGHTVTALDMAASGVNPKQEHELRSLSDYFEPLMEFLESLPAEERVILVGHSAGGHGISLAMERFPHKIAVAVFATAAMPGPDFPNSAIGEKRAQRPTDFMDKKFVYGNGPDKPATGVILGPKFLASNYYRLCPPEDLTLGTLLLRPFPIFEKRPAADQDEMVLTKEKYGSVHRVFVMCEEDNEFLQRIMFENNPPDEVKVVAGADHMVMLSRPQELCSCLQEIADQYP